MGNLSTASLDQLPQHLEMYLPAVVNLLLSFYVLLTGSKVAHMNRSVARKTYFLVANTHFGHINADGDELEDNDNEEESENVGVKESFLEIRRQNVYAQAQSVAQSARNRGVGISLYGLVLSRNLFLAFFSPFVAFVLFSINT